MAFDWPLKITMPLLVVATSMPAACSLVLGYDFDGLRAFPRDAGSGGAPTTEDGPDAHAGASSGGHAGAGAGTVDAGGQGGNGTTAADAGGQGGNGMTAVDAGGRGGGGGMGGAAAGGSDGGAVLDDAGGPDAAVECSSGLSPCGGSCVDLSDDVSHCGRCGHGCLGGQCADGACQPVPLSIDEQAPWYLAQSATELFWTDRDASRVRRIAKAGGSATTVAPTSDLPRGIAVNDTAVFYAERGIGVRIVPLGGGTPLTVGAGPEVWGLALNANTVFFSDLATGTVQSVPTSGGTVQTLVAGVGWAREFAVDAGFVYWSAPDSGQILKVPLNGVPDGGTAEAVTSGLTEPTGIAVDDTMVFITEAADPGAVKKVAKGGGGALDVATGQGMPTGIALTDTHVYWVAFAGGAVMRAAKSGGAPEPVVTGQTGPSRLVIDDAAIYWTDQVAGAVMKVAR